MAGKRVAKGLLDVRPAPRKQFKLPRYEPPRGKPKSLDASVLGKRNADRLKRLVEQGLERGGGQWYHTGPLYDEFVAELGPELGAERFDRYMDFVAATSPRSRVDANIKRASLLYGRELQGQPISGLTNQDFPKGYGHLAHKTQEHLLKDLEGGGHFEALSRPKTSSFAENLKGNLEPMTIDTHNRQAVFRDLGGKSPSNTEYIFLEDFQRKLADELGIAPAEWQSALWVGADEITGVADSRPFLEVFDDAVNRTAAQQGKTSRQVIRDFVNGKAPLASILIAGGVGAGLAPEEAEAAPYGKLAKQIGKKTRKAHHGSPHDFDKFDIKKIGTGEGAQAYGHGLYFTSKEEIARWYRDHLSPSDKRIDVGGHSWGDPKIAYVHEQGRPQADSMKHWAAERILKISRDEGDIPIQQAARRFADQKRTELDEYIGIFTDEPGILDADKQRQLLNTKREVLDFAESVANDEGASIGRSGKLYTVEIPDESNMLDWDKPLSEQPEGVRKALRSNWPLDDSFDEWAEEGMTGADLNRMMAVGANRATPDYPGTSAKLRELGIPGITYKGATSGERNFVIFDDELINLIEKGQVDPSLLPFLGAAGAGAGLAIADQGGYHPALEEPFEDAVGRFRAMRDSKRGFWGNLTGAADVVADIGAGIAGPMIAGAQALRSPQPGASWRRAYEQYKHELNYQPRTSAPDRLYNWMSENIGQPALQHLDERNQELFGLPLSETQATRDLQTILRMYQRLPEEVKVPVEAFTEAVP